MNESLNEWMCLGAPEKTQIKTKKNTHHGRMDIFLNYYYLLICNSWRLFVYNVD